MIIARIGANDPEFNLRPDPCFILRKKGKKEAVFVSIVESHGSYSPVEELPIEPFGSITDVSLRLNDEKYTAISFQTNTSEAWTLIIANSNNEKEKTHELIIGKDSFEWTGPYHLKQYKIE